MTGIDFITKNFWILFSSFFFAGIALSGSQDFGVLHVKSAEDGVYEIYQVSGSFPFQYISESVEQSNRNITLKSGSYLILGDCSSELVTIAPGAVKTLIAHTVKFEPPHPPSDQDILSIQCERFEKTLTKQHIKNRYTLNILSGQRMLLVNMKPLKVDFGQSSVAPEPSIITYPLSAVQVADFEDMQGDQQYFVSPADGLLSITEPQKFGHWQFLLAGKYVVEVNGTSTEVDLKPREARKIKPALLRVTTSSQIDLLRYTEVKGTPPPLEINAGHSFNLNETFPVVSGQVEISLGGLKDKVSVQLAEGQFFALQARSTFVDTGCSPKEWSCLGKEGVLLFHADQLYPFLEGVSDIPLIFFDREVWLSLKGSRGIRYRVPSEKRDSTFEVGFVELTPVISHKPGQITDLVRIEAQRNRAEVMGDTFDLPLERPIRVPLLVGEYFLAEYISKNTLEGERRKTQISFKVTSKSNQELSFNVFVSEKKYVSSKKALDSAKEVK